MSGNNVTAIVKKEKLQDNRYKPLPVWKILRDTESLLDKELRYNVLSSNCEHFATYLRYGKPESQQYSSTSVPSHNNVNSRTMSPTEDSKNPEAGDLIEIFRGAYQHWAIYAGRGYVIHITVPAERAPSSSGQMSGNNVMAIVKKEKLQDVVGNDRYRINNLQDKKYKPRPVWEILRDAESLLDKELPYNVLSSNCEHFATYLRYGKPESQQAQEAEALGILGLITALASAGLVLSNAVARTS